MQQQTAAQIYCSNLNTNKFTNYFLFLYFVLSSSSSSSSLSFAFENAIQTRACTRHTDTHGHIESKRIDKKSSTICWSCSTNELKWVLCLCIAPWLVWTRQARASNFFIFFISFNSIENRTVAGATTIIKNTQ